MQYNANKFSSRSASVLGQDVDEGAAGVLRERSPRATASPAARRRVMALARPSFVAISRRPEWAAIAASRMAAVSADRVGTLVAVGPVREQVRNGWSQSHMRSLMAS